LDLARAQDFNIKIITLPPEAGKDPDEAVRKNPQLWKDAIKNAVSIMDWLYRNAFRNRSASNPEDKKLIARDILSEVKRIADPVEKDHWVKKLAKDLDVSEGALREAMDRVKADSGPAKQGAPVKEAESRPKGDESHEQRLLALSVARFDLLKQAVDEEKLLSEELIDPTGIALYGQLKAAYAAGQVAPDPVAAGHAIRPPASLGPDEAKTFDAIAFLAEREFQGWTLDQLKQELKTAVSKLRLQRKKRERERLEGEMREAERLGDQARISELLTRFQSLT
jgi:DNA primase